ncbi:MAG: prolyl oligopeptidase family serine peptidase [Bacteroidales bacterium]|nr:prolyl oligopeptidase family serine peptidase [Bacteroidales bacterium]
MTRLISILLLILFVNTVAGQKPPLDNSVYDGWKSIGTQLITDDGKWVIFTIIPQQGDGWLYIYDAGRGVLDSVTRGSRPLVSPGQKYIVYQVLPLYETTRQAKKKKLKDDKMPKNGMEVYMLPGGLKKSISRVKSYELPEKNSEWMAYLLEKKTEEKKDSKQPADSSSAAKKNKKMPESKGSNFVIFNPVTGKEYTFPDVTEYAVAKDGGSISFLQSFPDTAKIEKLAVSVFKTGNEHTDIVFEGMGSVKKLSTGKTGRNISFLFSADTSKVKVYDLYLSVNSEKAVKISGTGLNPDLKGLMPSENGNISFSDDEMRIYFGTARKPVNEPVDTLLEDERYRLDIWSWDDDVLQPMQKKQLEQEKKRTWMAVYHTDSRKAFQLADTLMPDIRTYQKGNNRYALGSSSLKYLKASSWDGGSPSDYYLVDVQNGTKKLLKEKCSGRALLSPSCRYFVYWDNKELDWMAVSISTGESVNVTSAIEVPLCDELNDLPDDPDPHGIAGWLDDERHVLIYDRYDIWLADLEGKEKPLNLTNGSGRAGNIRFRYVKLDDDEEFVNRRQTAYLSAFSYSSKEAGFFTMNQIKQQSPTRLYMGKNSFPRGMIKAEKADRLIFNRGSYSEYPELYLSGMNLENPVRISRTNPQQSKYNWVTTELVEWKSFDNKNLQGLLFKPEDFDPSKKYPMIVYFYERSSDELYNYVAPVPSASIVNKTFAVSNGYLLFVPDIAYTTGYPGESCYNAVISGTAALADSYPFIDRNRLALDGQSWGGYQIAYLVTRTDMFACAYAGAPVSNMTSAYGGIRWESGMSRMFQYEHTQSRIGGTLWEKPINYIENSPLFFVPKINTPLLLMHNDADGAVPWYQGIEFINALRRLEKQAWMLSYNDEAHNLVRRANRKDISIRKMQFFDHYLKGSPMPYWMKYGISQLEKGKIDGYDLVRE